MVDGQLSIENTLNPDINGICDSLLTILKKEIEVYRELEETISEESGVLITPSLKSITKSNLRKETCLLKARILEEARMSVIRKISEQLAMDPKDINISKLLAFVDQNRKAALGQLQKELKRLGDNISLLNKNNMSMIDLSLAYIGNSLDFINSLLSVESGYASSGRVMTNSIQGQVIKIKG